MKFKIYFRHGTPWFAPLNYSALQIKEKLSPKLLYLTDCITLCIENVCNHDTATSWED